VATKKQQRRRQKLKRHDYEDVYVDEDGNVLEADQAEELVGPTTVRKAKDRPTTRSGRALEPPSWRKTGRRGLLFFPLMLITVMLLGRDLTLIQQVFQTVVLMCFFLPFSYFMDSMMWRSYERRVARSSEKKP
jgi:cytochrome c-type biogenesis protein CcmH/NrfG